MVIEAFFFECETTVMQYIKIDDQKIDTLCSENP